MPMSIYARFDIFLHQKWQNVRPFSKERFAYKTYTDSLSPRNSG